MTLGLKIRYGLMKKVGVGGADGVFTDLLKSQKSRMDRVALIPDDATAELVRMRGDAPRIAQEARDLATAGNHKEAAKKVNDELIPLLDDAIEAIDALAKKKRQFKDRVDAEKAKITGLRTGPNAIIHPDLDAATNTKITPAESSFATPQWNDAPGLRLLDEAAAAIDTAKRLLADCKDYEAKLRISQQLVDDLNIPANDLIRKDLDEIQKTKIDEAKKLALPATRNFAAAKNLLAQADAASKRLKSLMEKCVTATTAGKLDCDVSEFVKLKKHAQAAEFQADIDRMQKQVDVGKVHVEKGLLKAAESLFTAVHWDAVRRNKEADAHALYVAERNGPVKLEVDKLPSATGTPIDAEVAAIKKTHAGAETKAGKRLYDAAMALLADVKKLCAAALTKQAQHKAYDDVQKVIEQPVANLPPDSDKVIGPEAKAVRARLQAAKDAATNRDFVTAKKLADQAQTELAAAQKLAEDAAKHAEASKKAVEQAKPDDALAEVRKLWTSLTSKDTDKVVETLLKTIDDRLKEAAEALKA